MKLREIEFYNFKSIKNTKLIIKHNCMILVGKNEAGKSNILKGIAGCISPSAYELTPEVKRKRRYNEQITEAYIDLIFDFSDKELDDFIKYIDHNIKSDVFNIDGKAISNQEFIKTYCNKGIYRYDIITDTHEAIYNAFPDDINLIQNFTKLSSSYQQYSSDTIIPTPASGDVFSGDSLTLEDIVMYFSSYMTDYVESNLPKVYYWKNDNKFLLPASVHIPELTMSPSNYPTIQTLFSLAGYPNISTAFSDAQKEDGDYTNLLDNVAQKATTEFQKRWPDLKGLSFEFRKDGNLILIKIKEKVRYNFEDRSDGFKHFVSILLALSSQVAIKKINDAIIIIDEPDQSLYPTAAKYLRDELIKLSKNNIVIYATHSPFMIDDRVHSRHVIVKKENEITSIEPITDEEDSYQKDDVLLTAMGTSRFEFIKENNIIFEGWSDYNFFSIALGTNKKEYKDIKSFFKHLGTAFVHGVSSIKNLTPILQLANRNLFVVSDADEAAKNAQSSYKKTNGYQHQHWFTFKDLEIYDKLTIEDFIIGEELFQQALREMNLSDGDFSQRSKKGVLGCLAGLLKTKEEKQTFKNLVATQLTVDKIDPSYYSLLESLKGKIENATKDD